MKEEYEYILLKKYASYDYLNKKQYLERYVHSLGVANIAVELARFYKIDIDLNKVYITGLLHDYSKFSMISEYNHVIEKYELDKSILELNKKVWHGLIGAYIVKDELNINDDEIIDAIKYHVTGRPNMSELEKLIYIADIIEPNRVGEDYDEIRSNVWISIDHDVAFITNKLIEYLQKNTKNICKLTYNTYEYYKKYL